MRALNFKEINIKFTYFLAWFASLLIIISFSIYAFLHTWHDQVGKLLLQRKSYNQALVDDVMLINKVDSLLIYLNRLTSDSLQNGQNRYVQLAIIHRKQEIADLLSKQPDYKKNYAAYDRLIGHLNDLVILKDSINKVKSDINQLRFDLSQCIDVAKEPQRNIQKQY